MLFPNPKPLVFLYIIILTHSMATISQKLGSSIKFLGRHERLFVNQIAVSLDETASSPAEHIAQAETPEHRLFPGFDCPTHFLFHHH